MRKFKFIVQHQGFRMDCGGCMGMLTLCDALNKIGEESYLSERDSPDANINHFNLQCPIASDEVLNSDNTVAIYPEVAHVAIH